MRDLGSLREARSKLIAELAVSKRRTEDLRALLAEVDSLIAAREAGARSRPEHEDSRLLRQLTELRLTLAHAIGKGPYSVFDDDTLSEILQERPENELALYKIRGISAGRLQQYGDKIVACVLQSIDPGRPQPVRPYFEKCSFCGDLQVLVAVPSGLFRCNKCARSTDPRTKRPSLGVKLPTAKDFD